MEIKSICKFLPLLISVLFFANFVKAQDTSKPVTDVERREVLATLQKLVSERYIEPKVAAKVVDFLKTSERNGVYAKITKPEEFAKKLSEDLVSASNDKHFKLLFDPAWVADSKKATTKNEKDELLNRDLAIWKKDNFGFKEVKILDGNIGYLNLVSFRNPKYAGKTAEAAMAFLGNADAIIIDLRENGGGFSTMVQLLASYFFDGEPIQMGDSYSRATGKHTQDWTLPYVNGKRMPEIPLYILTSKNSFSAAEGFSYFMKNRKRAVLIGETTGGAAQPIERVAVSERFYLWLPNQKPVDPITNENWEGIGVKPDIATSAKNSLIIGQMEALKGLNSKKILDDRDFQWISDGLTALQNPLTVNHTKLRTYAGDYGTRKLIFEDGKLFYQRNGDDKYLLIPMAEDLFMINEASYLRIRIDIENEKVIGITRLYNDGTSRQDIRVKP